MQRSIGFGLFTRLCEALEARLLRSTGVAAGQPTPIMFPGMDASFKKPDGWNEAKSGKCESLPLQVVTEIDGYPITPRQLQSCWAFTLRQRLIMLLTGRLWVCCYGSQPPVALSVKRLYLPKNKT